MDEDKDPLTAALRKSGYLRPAPPAGAAHPPLPTPRTSPASPNATGNNSCDATTAAAAPPSLPSPTLFRYDYYHLDQDNGRDPASISTVKKKSNMTENVAPNGNGGPNGAAAGMPFYEKSRNDLRNLIAKRKMLEKKLFQTEEVIYEKETDYLENTPSGNIIIGFDNYTKGTTGAAAQRRKTGLTDANRVFSRSSISYNPNVEIPTPAASTPASHAPTPASTSFANKDKADSAAATPTSTTASKASKKGKKTAARPDDSETDAPAGKKGRTSFGVSRK